MKFEAGGIESQRAFLSSGYDLRWLGTGLHVELHDDCSHFLDINLGFRHVTEEPSGQSPPHTPCPPNTFSYFPAGEQHRSTRLRADTSLRLKFSIKCIQTPSLRGVFEAANMRISEHFDSIIVSAGWEIHDYLCRPDRSVNDAHVRLLCDLLFVRLAHIIRMNDRSATQPFPYAATKGRIGGHDQIQKALQWLEQNLCDPSIRVDDLAAQSHLSARTFGKRFKSSVGESPYAYVLRRRAELARDRILSTPEPLAQIAYEAGFSSQAHMTTTFRRYFEITPGQLRSPISSNE